MMLTRTKFSPQIFPFLTYRSSPTSSVRHYSQQNEDDSSSNNNSSNKSLNLSFQGVIPKLLALEKGLISSGTGRKEYIELQKRGIFSTTFQGLVLYSHLQNPLLKKYAFDLSDFFEGAKESFKLIRNLSASKDFVEYSIGKPVTSIPESVKFIEQVLVNEEGNEPFRDLLKATRKFTLFRKFCASAIVLPWMRIDEIRDLKIVKMVVDSISTRVVETIEEKKEKNNCTYPEGSVVASVHVFYETVEYHPIQTSPEWDKSPLSSPFSSSDSPSPSSSSSTQSVTLPDWERSRIIHVTFEGCISGHTPLDWKVAAMDYYDKNLVLEVLFKRLPDLDL